MLQPKTEITYYNLADIENQWTEILVNWINKCMQPTCKIQKLNEKILWSIIKKYKEEIKMDRVEKALTKTNRDNLEAFVAYKYPSLKIRKLKDKTRRLYLLASLILFHCCINCKTGVVDRDICDNLDKDEQLVILMFCEALSEMDVTVNNIERGVIGAFEETRKLYSGEKSLDTISILSLKTLVSAIKTKINSKNPGEDLKCQLIFPSNTVQYNYNQEIYKDSTNDAIIGGRKTEIDEQNELPKATRKPDNLLPKTISFKRPNEMLIFSVGIEKPSKTDRPLEPSEAENGEKAGNEENFVTSLNKPTCSCTKCLKKVSNHCPEEYAIRCRFKWKLCLVAILGFLMVVALLAAVTVTIVPVKESLPDEKNRVRKARRTFDIEKAGFSIPNYQWICKNKICQKINVNPETQTNQHFASLSRCILLCTGPGVWPKPTGYTFFSKKLLAINTQDIKPVYKHPSLAVRTFLETSYRWFLRDLMKMESLRNRNYTRNKVYVRLKLIVTKDSNPSLKLNTNESYKLTLDNTPPNLLISIESDSFCGVRHGLQSLSQMILFDPATDSLITISDADIHDKPSFAYRGLMLDTTKNHIPAYYLIRTIDIMAKNKLNTLHWRISDTDNYPFQTNAMNQSDHKRSNNGNVYKKNHITLVADRAKLRGIRVLIEVILPGRINKPLMIQDTCAINKNCTRDVSVEIATCNVTLNRLQNIYEDIIKITKVSDLFRISEGLLSKCALIKHEGVKKVFQNFNVTNKNVILLIWYDSQLVESDVLKDWNNTGVQLTRVMANEELKAIKKFRVVHSSKWDLSCQTEFETCIDYISWQDMYAWRPWNNTNTTLVLGGEAILWPALVDSEILDSTIWPRTSAVAERLWSDSTIPASVTTDTYVRLSYHETRLAFEGVEVEPIWDYWCNFNMEACIERLNNNKL